MPRSHVSDFRSSAGKVRTCLPRVRTTVWVSLPVSLTNSVNRERRSTRVAMWVFCAPAKRSPSQWPGTARASTAAGRSRIDTASMICPRGCPSVLARFERRIVRRVRRCRTSSFLSTPRAWMKRLR
jgi:hypothetical protein